MKKIKLTKNGQTIVDDDMFEYLSQWSWQQSTTGYAVRRHNNSKGRSTTRMHRLITNCPEGKFVDHINRNPLDNRRANLRVVTHLENMQNLGVRKDNKYGVPGVDFIKRNKIWRARLRYKKVDYAKNCKTFEEAVKARKEFEKLYKTH